MKKKNHLSGVLERNGNKRVVVKLSCFPTRFLCGVSRFFISDEWSSVRNKIGRCRIKCGKTPNLMGFTLIELLVVVLIIGILAAVALPQYKIAVGKARMTQLITFANSVKQAQQRYHLANGTYANKWDELDVDLTGYTTANAGKFLVKGSAQNAQDPYAELNYQDNGLYFYGGANYLPGILLIVANKSDVRLCYARNTDTNAQTLCKHVCQKKTLGTDGSWKTCTF